MRVIHKHILIGPGINTILMPLGSEVLKVGMQPPNIVVWVRSQPLNTLVNHHVIAVMTGEPMPEGYELAPYISTLQIQQQRGAQVQELVIHFFDGGEGPAIVV